VAGKATASTTVAGVDADRVLARWRDAERWPRFVDGCAGIVERDPAWPAPGSWLVWRSPAGGRGTVREEVAASDAAGLVTRVTDPSLRGTQAFGVADGGEEGLLLTLELEYELVGASPFQAAMDALFIRRALRDSLRRTLTAFAAQLRA
jgi:hypothetical protein